MTTTSTSQTGADAAESPQPCFRRVLLKISGEAFCRPGGFGIDGDELVVIAREITAAAQIGAQLAVVVGGGNIIRGADLAKKGHIDQTTGDYMGMLGIAINGLALKEVLEKLGQPARVLSAINLSAIAETFIRGRAIRHLEKGRVVIFVAGTGNPFFSTDTAAALRASEVKADVILKATKVDGVYDRDPLEFPGATKYGKISFVDALKQRLNILDSTAFSLCLDNNVPILVFDLKDEHAIRRAIMGETIGTLVS